MNGKQIMWVTRGIWIGLGTCWMLALGLNAAVSIGHVSDFESGGDGWGLGSAALPLVEDAGPLGEGDAALEMESTGGGGPGSKYVFFNDSAAWTGDYAAAGVGAIRCQVRHITGPDLQLRLAFQGGNGAAFCSLEPVLVAAGTEWQELVFMLDAASMSLVEGSGDFAAALADVKAVRILSSKRPSWRGDTIAARSYFDQIGIVAAEVTFADTALERAVLEALGQDAGPVSGIHLGALTSLDASKRGITSLTGLEAAYGLQQLDLNGNRISELAPLAGLRRLRALSIYGNQISDISVLAGLSQLELLSQYHNQIVDLSPLAGLNKLRELYSCNNQVSDISALSGLSHLEVLMLYNNQVSDLSALAGLTALRTLHLRGNRIVDLQPLVHLIQLETLYLRENQLVDITPLGQLRQLVTLDLADNAIVDISILAELPALAQVQLERNQLDLSVGSSALDVIAGLEADGVSVNYADQPTPRRLRLEWMAGQLRLYVEPFDPARSLICQSSVDLSDPDAWQDRTELAFEVDCEGIGVAIIPSDQAPAVQFFRIKE